MKPCIAIASSDKLLTAAYRAFLAAEGFETIAVANGLSCLDAVRCRPLALLIIDGDLPWGAGLGVLSLLCENSGLPRIPVVLLLDASSPLPPLLPKTVDCTLLPRRTRPAAVAALVHEAMADWRNQPACHSLAD